MEKITRCIRCKAEVTDGKAFCLACRTKQGSLNVKKADKPAENIGNRWAVQTHASSISSGRSILLFLAIILVVGGFILAIPVMNGISSVEEKVNLWKTNQYEEPETIEEAEAGILMAKIMLVISLGIQILLAGGFFGLWFLAKKHPFTAFLIALCVYLVMSLVDIAILLFSDNMRMSAGMVMKTIIIILLIRGMMAAHKYKKLVQAKVVASPTV